MMPLKTLRGVITMDDNDGESFNNLIFNFESLNRKRAWRIKEAYLWPATATTSVSADDQMMVQANLATDNIRANIDNVLNISDTRLFGFLYSQYLLREDGSADFLVPNGFGIRDSQFLLDPDTIVTNQLYLNARTDSDSVSSNLRKWSYLIVMESLSISPEESILQQLKGIGQDISA